MSDRPTWDETWLALAELMSQRSRCPTGAGAVIVDAQNRVVATGYAGPPADFVPERDDSLRSLPYCQPYCLRQRRHALARKPSATGAMGAGLAADYSDCPSSHAEMNAISFADRTRTEGGTFYVSRCPCMSCTKVIGNCGVIRAVWRPSEQDHVPGVNIEKAIRFLEQCGIEVNTDV